MSCMKEHFQAVASLLALLLVIVTVIFLAVHGMKDETLLAILATGAVGIASTIAGVKPPTGTQQPQIPQLPQLPQQPQAPQTPQDPPTVA